MTGVYGNLTLIGGAVYVEKATPTFAWRYVGELVDGGPSGPCKHVFRSCRSGKLWSCLYTEAEARLTLLSPC